MKSDYKLEGSTAKISVEVEKKVSEDLKVMSQYSQFSESEIVNTAIKKFVSTHRDFFPPPERQKKST